MKLTVSNISAPLNADDAVLLRRAAAKAGLDARAVRGAVLLHRSIDARRKNDIHFTVKLELDVEDAAARRALSRDDGNVRLSPPVESRRLAVRQDALRGRVIVVGLGPAGLFAARELAEYGFTPLVIERGKRISERAADVSRYWNGGALDFESNVMFGEGGAGTFSDGKLTSRSKDPRSARVLETFARLGAPKEILYDAKPHVGTDRLRNIVSALRGEIEALGGEVHFSAKLLDVTRNGDGRLGKAVVSMDGRTHEIPCAALILAAGQGARDTVRMLHARGVAIEKKPTAVGVRIEHPQKMINTAQYGALADNPLLGAAPYALTANAFGRGVYTFCMCPGGQVIASASGDGQAVVNGMSNYARDGENANAALVVQVRPEDMPEGDLGGIEFCEAIEKSAFMAGGGTGRAPAETVGDFLAHKKPAGFGKIQPTYRPGVVPCDLHAVLPRFICDALMAALPVFGRQLTGFDRLDAVLTAVESRTSAPYRILRNETMQSPSLPGLYPVGEGAGYAGGIVSSAIDRLSAAEAVIVGEDCSKNR